MEYVTTRNFDEFRVVVDELKSELGDRFPISIQNWCGIGSRPYPLPAWNIFLVKDGAPPTSEAVGICSYYRQVDDPPGRYWIGWIGVRPEYRRAGRASMMLKKVCADLKSLGATTICVYTSNPEAVALYRSIGMTVQGTFSGVGLEQAAASGDETLLSLTVY